MFDIPMSLMYVVLCQKNVALQQRDSSVMRRWLPENASWRLKKGNKHRATWRYYMSFIRGSSGYEQNRLLEKMTERLQPWRTSQVPFSQCGTNCWLEAPLVTNGVRNTKDIERWHWGLDIHSFIFYQQLLTSNVLCLHGTNLEHKTCSVILVLPIFLPLYFPPLGLLSSCCSNQLWGKAHAWNHDRSTHTHMHT